MIDFDTTRGCIYYGTAKNLLNEVLPQLGNFNPKIRLLVFLTGEVSIELLREIFTTAWNDFKICEIFITFDIEFRKFFQPFSIYVFNIFSTDHIDTQLIEINFPFALEGLEKLEAFDANLYKNLNNFPLKVVLFQFMMVCHGIEFENGSYIVESLKWQDAEAMKIISKVANFSIEFVKSPDGVKHGYQTSNFTFTGSLGMVEYEHADLAANARLVAEYNTSNTICLFPTTTTKLKFTVPKKTLADVNILVSFYNFLDLGLRISLLAMFITLPIVMICFDYINGSGKNAIDSLIDYYLMFHSIMTFVSIRLPTCWPLRCIVGSVIIVWLIVGNTYAGKMIEFLNTNFGLKQLKSIEEMTQTSLEVKVPYPMAILFEGEFEDATENHLFLNKVVKKARALESVGDRMAFIDVDNMDEMMRSRKYALLFLDNLIELWEKSYYDENGNDILTHIDETPYEYYYAMSVPKTSPFVNRFNDILMHIFEAGILKYQMNMANADTDLIMIQRVKAGKIASNDVKPISLIQIYSIFYLLLVSLGFCFLVFLVEVFVGRFIRKRNENGDFLI